MEDNRQNIRNHDLEKKWAFLSESWNTHLSSIDAILIKDGVEDDEVMKLKTSAIQEWFFRYEFINSLIVITKKNIVFLGNKEKIELMKLATEKACKGKRELICIEKSEGMDQDEMVKFFNEIDKLDLKKLGIFKKESQKGMMIEQLEQHLSKGDYQEIDVSTNIQEIISVKLNIDIDVIRTASQGAEFLFRLLIEKIEMIIEHNEKKSHINVTSYMEEQLTKGRSKLESSYNIRTKFFDYAYAPIIQSNDEYSLKPNWESNNKTLSFDCILLNLACKYHGLNVNIFRTLMINPTETDKENYKNLNNIHKKLLHIIKPGKVYKDIHAELLEYVQVNFPNLVSHLPSNFGFGIGYEFKEACLLINKKNTREVKKGNVLNVITSLKGLKGFKNQKDYNIHIADTVYIDEEGNLINLTKQTAYKFEDIGYNIDLDDEPVEDNGHAITYKDDGGVRKRTRAAKRGQQMAEEHARQQKMKENQQALMNKKMDELLEKLQEGEFENQTDKSNKIILEKMNSYSPENFPDHVNKNNLYVDNKKYSVLIPMGKHLVPFHVLCIKNVTKHTDGKTVQLRINFQTPAISTGNIVFPTVESFGSQPIYIKELSLKSSNIDNINTIHKQIKELQKKYRLQFNLASKQVKENEKETLKSRLKTLNDLKMRPTMAGKKTIGHLTSYANGFKFVSKRSEVFELFLSNIKHAIFQPCDDSMIIIIHFNLYNPVIINKKLTNNVQFFIEVGHVIEDLNDPRKRKGVEFEEFEEEQLEQQARERHNKLFLDFITYTEKNWQSDLKFDMPTPELGFYGSHASNNVFIVPTRRNLVSLIENPFLVVSLDEIELVSIERVDNIIKNFDIAIIFKDYSRQVLTISNIPKTSLETIKEWLK